MAKAKRIFEIAKELGIKSKAIVEKCHAEGIPQDVIKGHMSSVSVGLEATIREWFASEDASEIHTAVEQTAKVDLKKVRAKAKAKAKPLKAAKVPVDDAPDQVIETATAVAVAPPEPTDGPASTAQLDAKTDVDEFAQVELVEPADSESTKEVAVSTAPAAKPKPVPFKPAPMNVPNRPKAIEPVGPKLEERSKVKLSGPKVIRVEAPEVIEPPRHRRPGPAEPGSMPTSRGPRGGGGAGMAPMVPDMPEGKDSRRDSNSGNKRKTGAGGGGGGGGSTRRRGGSGSGSTGSWRQQDLIEREARLQRSGGYFRKRRQQMRSRESTHEHQATLAETGGQCKIQEPITIKELSAATGVKGAEIVKKLFLHGVMATINSAIETERAMEIMMEYNIELEVVQAKSAEQVVSDDFEEREATDLRPRGPVVTILGHVDHGKTSLLDRIRNANVAEGEAGGITQATSAFRVSLTVAEEERQIVFLDTPGHEAFTAMRARGANITDIVVLVVAADDGVMPQTIESINHAKAAGVPIIIALNKIDKPEATDSNIQKIYGQLAEHELNPTEWGGNTEVIKTSAISGDGVTELLEVLDYQAQLLELTADFAGPARGSVIESRMIEGRGSVASVLIQDGELKIGSFVVAGRAFGRIRDITDDRGNRIKTTTPPSPVQISGLDELPDAGDRFYVVDSLKKAQEAAEQRREREREVHLAQPKVTLDSLFEAEFKEINVVVKADVQGSIEVLKSEIERIQHDEVKVRVLHAAVGGVTESDVLLAEASNAIIIGFNVIASAKARQLGKLKGVEVRNYQVIYDITDDIKKAAEGLLTPELRQEVIGHAEVRKVFKVSKVGTIAGCYVTDGTVERDAFVRVTRDDIVIEDERVLEQLKRFKDDAKDVRSGMECGMKIVGYDDIKEGDIIECYKQISIKRKL